MAIARVLATDDLHAPEGFQRVDSEQAARISWRGPGHGTCIVAGLLGLLLCAALLAGVALGPWNAEGLGMVTALVAAISVYVLLVGSLNRTVVSLQDHHLSIRQRPLRCPWPVRFQAKGPREIPAADVYRVWVEEEPAPASRNGRQPTQGLMVMTIGTGREELLTRLKPAEAAYLERELKGLFGIEN